MFVQACNQIRECIYGVIGESQIGQNMVTGTNGSGFMIAPGVLVTAAHMCHSDNDFSKPLLQKFQAIRSPDVGQKMELITLIAGGARLQRVSHAATGSPVPYQRVARTPWWRGGGFSRDLLHVSRAL